MADDTASIGSVGRRSISGRLSKRVSAFAMQKLNRKVSSTGDVHDEKKVQGLSIKSVDPENRLMGEGKVKKRRKKRSLDSADFMWKMPEAPKEGRGRPRPLSLIDEIKFVSTLKGDGKIMEQIIEAEPTNEVEVAEKSGEDSNTKKRRSERKSRKSDASAISTQDDNNNKKKKRKRSNEWTNGDSVLIDSTPGEEDSQQLSALTNPVWLMFDSEEAGECVLEWIINPMKPKNFFKEKWEEKPLLIKRDCPSYYGDIFSTADLDDILRTKSVEFGASIDVTKYINQKRYTFNPKGRAVASKVWDFYNDGCSVRMRDPGNHKESVWKICQVLQEAFGSFVGANVYLTPPGTQGFAPHWDDIDAFVMQLEGSKYWRVYGPRTPEEKLPREPSENFCEADLPEAPLVEGNLEPGDLLYIPRGMIHQGKTIGDQHSLHITISACQKNTWQDLLSDVLPAVLEVVGAENSELRRSLPRNFLSTMGVANDVESKEASREKFKSKLREMLDSVVDTAMSMVDESVDQFAKEYMHAALPPLLTENEKSCGIADCGNHWNQSKEEVEKMEPLQLGDRVKLLRKHICRLVDEDDAAEADKVRIYHCVENTRSFKEKDPQYFDIDSKFRPCVYYLLAAYPDYTEVRDIAEDDPDLNNSVRREICQELFVRGLLIKESG